MVVERVLISKCDGASALIRTTMDAKFEHAAVSMIKAACHIRSLREVILQSSHEIGNCRARK